MKILSILLALILLVTVFGKTTKAKSTVTKNSAKIQEAIEEMAETEEMAGTEEGMNTQKTRYF